MNENEAFVKIVKTAILGFLVIVVLGMGSCQMTNYHIGKAIENGTNPYAAKCAFTGNGNSVTCALIAMENNNV